MPFIYFVTQNASFELRCPFHGYDLCKHPRAAAAIRYNQG